jgi:uncharacterized membrane protein YccF (DUF307 family)
MRFIGNILWLVFGGLLISILYFIASIFIILTIVGIPFGIQTLKLAGLALWPFGRDIYIDQPQGCLGILLNVIWLFCGGIWIAVAHLILGAFFAITIVGIPFALQHFKLASVGLMPFGRHIRMD